MGPPRGGNVLCTIDIAKFVDMHDGLVLFSVGTGVNQILLGWWHSK